MCRRTCYLPSPVQQTSQHGPRQPAQRITQMGICIANVGKTECSGNGCKVHIGWKTGGTCSHQELLDSLPQLLSTSLGATAKVG